MTVHDDAPAQGADRSPAANVEEDSRRVSRWVSILYLVTALAAPLLLYFGPDVLSPAAPAIANAALDGRFTVHRRATCDATRSRTPPVRTTARC